jgi:hypothetical protein
MSLMNLLALLFFVPDLGKEKNYIFNSRVTKVKCEAPLLVVFFCISRICAGR